MMLLTALIATSLQAEAAPLRAPARFVTPMEAVVLTDARQDLAAYRARALRDGRLTPVERNRLENLQQDLVVTRVRVTHR